MGHIAGPTGSGKTTISNAIKNKYPYILVKDLDDLFLESPTYFPKEYLELKNNNKQN